MCVIHSYIHLFWLEINYSLIVGLKEMDLGIHFLSSPHSHSRWSQKSSLSSSRVASIHSFTWSVCPTSSPQNHRWNLSIKSSWPIKSIRLFSHLSNPLAPLPTLSILGSEITFYSPTKTTCFRSAGTAPTVSIGHINCNHLESDTFNGNISYNLRAPIICKGKIEICVKAVFN